MEKETQRSEIQSPDRVLDTDESKRPSFEPKVAQVSSNDTTRDADISKQKKPWWNVFLVPGSAAQIVSAAALAIALGMIITTQVDDIPQSAVVLVGIPGVLWLRALKAVVLPLIATAIILSIQRLKAMTRGGAVLARWTITYFVLTTLIAIAHSTVMVSQVWSKLMREVDRESLNISAKDQELYEERQSVAIHTVVADMFNSLVTDNPVNSLAQNHFLAVLVAATVIGYLIKAGSSLMRAVEEIDNIITTIITALIKLAPIGVFFLILPNLFRLNISEMGFNMGILIAGSLTGMGIHLFVVLPAIYFAFVRKNPWAFWFKNSPAWITAWGTASSAATLPVTLRCCRARGVPETVVKFVVPLGCLINMDGTAIYFPVVVVFLAATQGIVLNAVDYIIIILLSTLASIGTTPIPSSSLVLVVMIAGSVNVPITGMYAVVVAIDWFLDRFRTAVNVSGDMFASAVMQKITGIDDTEVHESVYDERDGLSADANGSGVVVGNGVAAERERETAMGGSRV